MALGIRRSLMFQEDLRERLGRVRDVARQKLVQNTTKGIDVCARID